MNNPINPAQTHSPQNPSQQTQAPDHRLDEIMTQMKQMRDENQQLRGQIDFMAKSKDASQPAAPQESPFDEKVDAALTAKFQQLMQQSLDPLRQQMTNQVGYLVDKTDELGYNQKYGGNEKYKKLESKVADIRREYEMKNQYITREEALRVAYFEETGKKAQEAPAPVSQEPVYDPYFNAYVDPATKLPVDPAVWQQQQAAAQGQAVTHEIQGAPVPQGPPAWQQPQQVQPVQQQQMNPQGYGVQPNQNPMMNPFGNAPSLPDQGMNTPFPSQSPHGSSPLNLSLESTDAELSAYESKFGDIPL